MRTYPQDSPRSVARLVALAMLADGHVCSREFEALERAQAQLANGLSNGRNCRRCCRSLCEDLMMSGHLGSMGGVHLDADTLAGLMAEVEDPKLRLAVVQAWVSAIDADEHRADAEDRSVAGSGAMLGHRPLPALIREPSPCQRCSTS